MGIKCPYSSDTEPPPGLGMSVFLLEAPSSFLLSEEHFVFRSPGNSLNNVLHSSVYFEDGKHRERKEG